MDDVLWMVMMMMIMSTKRNEAFCIVLGKAAKVVTYVVIIKKL